MVDICIRENVKCETHSCVVNSSGNNEHLIVCISCFVNSDIKFFLFLDHFHFYLYFSFANNFIHFQAYTLDKWDCAWRHCVTYIICSRLVFANKIKFRWHHFAFILIVTSIWCLCCYWKWSEIRLKQIEKWNSNLWL